MRHEKLRSTPDLSLGPIRPVTFLRLLAALEFVYPGKPRRAASASEIAPTSSASTFRVTARSPSALYSATVESLTSARLFLTFSIVSRASRWLSIVLFRPLVRELLHTGVLDVHAADLGVAAREVAGASHRTSGMTPLGCATSARPSSTWIARGRGSTRPF